jgi:hypothetical protein
VLYGLVQLDPDGFSGVAAVFGEGRELGWFPQVRLAENGWDTYFLVSFVNKIEHTRYCYHRMEGVYEGSLPGITRSAKHWRSCAHAAVEGQHLIPAQS